MFGTPKQNFFNPGTKTEPSRKFPTKRELIYFPTITSRVMHGIIASTLLTMPMDSSNFLEVKRNSLRSLISSSKEVNTGQPFGSPILTIGQEINIIFSPFGSSPSPIDPILLKNTQG